MDNNQIQNQQLNEYYVYLHKRLSDNRVFYVGKGKNGRCKSRSGKNKHWHNTVAKHGYYIEIIKENISEQYAFYIEILTIRNFKTCGFNLTNRSVGGEGNSGVVHTEETKQKWRIAKLGKKQSPEHAKKSAMSRIGKRNTAWHIERTVEGKRKRIINSDGVCFISSCHAARYLNDILGKKCYQGIISMSARGIRSNAYGLTWSYDTNKTPVFKKRKLQEKKIRLIEKNLIFDSVQKAKDYIILKIGKANNQCISQASREGNSAYGYHWEYI